MKTKNDLSLVQKKSRPIDKKLNNKDVSQKSSEKKRNPNKNVLLKTNISTSISYEEIGIAVKRQTKEFEDFLRVHYVG